VVVFGTHFLQMAEETIIIRELRFGIRWTNVYNKQLPVLLETAIVGRLFLTARLHLKVGRTRSFGDI